MPGIIDSFFVALGYQIDDSELQRFKGQVDSAKDSIMDWGAAITGLITGVALHKVAEIGSQFEQNRIQIAGFLNGLGMKSTFNEGLESAGDIIQQITKDAAKLPGEAEEYIEVFKAGLPFVQGAMPGGSLKDITNFTNQLTAIGKTFGLDAGLIAREFDHMLSPGKGMASLRLPLFRQLLPFMKQVQGQAHLTAESFNQMTAPQRLQLLQGTFSKLQPMLDASANSFDAMWGAMVSGVKMVVRLATGGLFAGMKKSLDKLNNLFIDSDGHVTETGQKFVDAMGIIGHALGRFLEMGTELVVWFAKNEHAVDMMKAAFTVLGAVLAGMAWQKTVAIVTKLFGLLRSGALVTGGLALAIFLLSEDLWGFYHGADSVTGLLLNQFPHAIEGIIGLLSALTLALSPPLFAVGLLVLGAIYLYKHWQDFLDFVQGGLNGWVNVLNLVIDKLNEVIGIFSDAAKIGHIGGFSFADDHRFAKEGAGMLPAGEGVRAPAWAPGAPGYVGPAPAQTSLMPAGWSAASVAGVGSGRGMPAPNVSSVTVGSINVAGTSDPEATARATQRKIRNMQSGVVR